MGKLKRSLRVLARARNLFVVINEAKVYYDPFDKNATTAREMLRRFQSNAVLKNNPKILVEGHQDITHRPPRIEIQYHDGDKQHLFPSGLPVQDILGMIESVARWKLPGAQNPFVATAAKSK
mmetsp:Transcript_2235/g.4042  ORF Transcript_2235/g.4042 Transcript_2235/m.4042 type:complete len:122 (-) Transcript_2235:62-427(-)